VVQFSGHGGRSAARAQQGPTLHRDVIVDLGPDDSGECNGLFFQGADGAARVVTATALRDTFGAAGSSVKLVVLNACYSEVAAEALLAHVDCVVGMAGSIRDDAARSFAVGLYGGLGERPSVEAAYKGGCAAVGLEGLPEGNRARLRVRRGVDPATLILAALTPAGASPIAAERQLPGARHRSTVKSTAGEPAFTGREAELDAIADRLRGERVVVLHGAPGLGKSRLAREYAHQHAEAYPGGMFFIPFEQPPPVELAKLLHDTDRPAEPGEPVEDQCRRALRGLGSTGSTLLIYDAIADERTLRAWLPYDGLDWHLIATSTSASWARAWSRVAVPPLHADAERVLVVSILGDGAADRLARRIVAKAAGVTVELCASSAAAYERLCLGYSVEDVEATLATETTSASSLPGLCYRPRRNSRCRWRARM
jgi:hypothetical protein